MELIFEVRDAEEGGFVARALGHAIFTEAETWDELRANVLEAVSLHFEDARTVLDWSRYTTFETSRFPWKLHEATARRIRRPPDQYS